MMQKRNKWKIEVRDRPDERPYIYRYPTEDAATLAATGFRMEGQIVGPVTKE